jgi:hypothetical protein
MDEELIFKTTDPRGYTVVMTKEQYEGHILAGHKEMSNHDDIRQCIERPDYIFQSRDFSSREVYFSKTSSYAPPLYVTTVVETNGCGVYDGRVVTSHLRKEIKGDIVLSSEGILYDKHKA